jgi:hypothetical protein
VAFAAFLKKRKAGVKKEKRSRDAPHVRLYFAEMESEAFKALSPEGVCVLLEMRKEYRGRPDNRFSLPYSEIQKRRPMNRDKVSRGVLEAQEFGFIDCPVQGGLFKKANVYSLSERWKEISRNPELLAQAKKKIEDWMKNQRASHKNPVYLANYKAVLARGLESDEK